MKAGVEDGKVNAINLDEDWDPEKYDKEMRRCLMMTITRKVGVGEWMEGRGGGSAEEAGPASGGGV